MSATTTLPFGLTPSLLGEDAGILRIKRDMAIAGLAGLSLPHAHEEEWRRSDPSMFLGNSFTRLPDLAARKSSSTDAWDETFDVVVEVDDLGFSITDRTGAMASGQVNVTSLVEAAKSRPDLLQKFLLGAASPVQPRFFNHLNAAFWNAGFLVHVGKDVALKNGVLIRYHIRRSGSLLIPRVLFVAEDASKASVVEHFTSDPSASVLCLGAREFYAGKGAQLHVVSIQEWGPSALQIGEDWARIDGEGRVDWVTLALGGKASKNMVGCDVCAPGAHAQLSGVFFADADQHFDQRTLQLHSSPDTTSYLLYKGAVKDRGRSVYQGVINAKPGAIRVDAYQMNNNLILSEGARADSLPGLEIDADDLKCSHGATTGTLDPDQLFYLQSRGLAASVARRLMVEGFFEDVIAQVPHAFVQERLREQIRRKMGDSV